MGINEVTQKILRFDTVSHVELKRSPTDFVCEIKGGSGKTIASGNDFSVGRAVRLAYADLIYRREHGQ